MTETQLISRSAIQNFLKTRPGNSHKYTFGHALIVAGQRGMAGASVLSTRACLRSGAGLVTVHAPSCNRIIVQTAVPEAIFSSDAERDCISQIILTRKYDAIAIGPGIGSDEKTSDALCELLQNADCPLILDADALNIISQDKSLLNIIPPNSIITPHSKEFERLFGAADAVEMAIKYKIVIVLKSSKTLICAPTGESYLHSADNSGMATAGSGDVLTGIVAALVAQHYEPLHSAILAVYIHSLAGRLALVEQSEESMLASDIIENLGKAFKNLRD